MLDAGTTDTGRPYFVMEYVPGKPITQFCDEQSPVASASGCDCSCTCATRSQHAHTKAIIHRDIKPSNVLASCTTATAGRQGDRLRHRQSADRRSPDRRTRSTPSAARSIGTYDCMSPEQADRLARHRHAHRCVFAGRAAVRTADRRQAVRSRTLREGSERRSSGSSARSIRRGRARG